MKIGIEFKGRPVIVGNYLSGSSMMVLMSKFSEDQFVPLVDVKTGIEVYIASDTVASFWEAPEVNQDAD